MNSHYRMLFTLTALMALGCTALSLLVTTKAVALAFFCGFSLLSANIFALIYGMGLLVEAIQRGQMTPKSRWSILILGLKFFALVGILYLLIVPLKLSVLGIFIGSLAALVWMTSALGVSYLRSLRA